MSRIGTNPITVPASVTISVADGVATVEGSQRHHDPRHP